LPEVAGWLEAFPATGDVRFCKLCRSLFSDVHRRQTDHNNLRAPSWGRTFYEENKMNLFKALRIVKAKSNQPVCNYADNYYGDCVCQLSNAVVRSEISVYRSK
jgi:hypothetical protein